jgi:56kDa selenium binding protein (SBP56)
VLDAKTFALKGRWENGGETPRFNYDFWYQPRRNALISSEFGQPNAYEKGFSLDDVAAGNGTGAGSTSGIWARRRCGDRGRGRDRRSGDARTEATPVPAPVIRANQAGSRRGR